MMRTLAVVILAAVLAGCSSTRPARSSAAPDASATGPAEAYSGPDDHRRVVLYEPRTETTLILVSEGHPDRRTQEGRLRLALGRTRQTYKVIGAETMDAVFDLLEKGGYSRLGTPFARGDERLLDPRERRPRFRGLLIVEQQGRVSKVVGYKPAGPTDVDGQRRYQDFVRLKGIVYYWYNSKAESEDPLSGVSMPSVKR